MRKFKFLMLMAAVLLSVSMWATDYPESLKNNLPTLRVFEDASFRDMYYGANEGNQHFNFLGTDYTVAEDVAVNGDYYVFYFDSLSSRDPYIKVLSNSAWSAGVGKNISNRDSIHFDIWVPQASKLEVRFEFGSSYSDSLVVDLQEGWNSIDTAKSAWKLATYDVNGDSIHDGQENWASVLGIYVMNYTTTDGTPMVNQPLAITNFYAYKIPGLYPESVPGVTLDERRNVATIVYCPRYENDFDKITATPMGISAQSWSEYAVNDSEKVMLATEFMDDSTMIRFGENEGAVVDLTAYTNFHISVWRRMSGLVKVMVHCTDEGGAYYLSHELYASYFDSHAFTGWVDMDIPFDDEDWKLTDEQGNEISSEGGTFNWSKVDGVVIEVVGAANAQSNKYSVAVSNVYFWAKKGIDPSAMLPYPDFAKWNWHNTAAGGQNVYRLITNKNLEQGVRLKPTDMEKDVDYKEIENGADTVIYYFPYAGENGRIALQNLNSSGTPRRFSLAEVDFDMIHFNLWTPKATDVTVRMSLNAKGKDDVTPYHVSMKLSLKEGWNNVDIDTAAFGVSGKNNNDQGEDTLIWWKGNTWGVTIMTDSTFEDNPMAVGNMYLWKSNGSGVKGIDNPAKPMAAEDSVMALFSAHYNSNTKGFLPINGWVDGKNWILRYDTTQSMVAWMDDFTWGGFCVDGIADDNTPSVDVSGYDIFHIDIYVTVASNIKVTFQAAANFKDGVTIEGLVANQWNSIDIALKGQSSSKIRRAINAEAGPLANYDFKNLKYLIIEGFTNEHTPVGISNAYFKKASSSEETGLFDTEVANDGEKVIKRIENGQIVIIRDGKKFNTQGIEL